MVWDADDSVAVMAPNSSGIVSIAGGRAPFEWTVVGSGFQFSNGSKRITTTGKSIYFAALPLACGTAEITVTDGCSAVVGVVLATIGAWIDQGSSIDCHDTGAPMTEYIDSLYAQVWRSEGRGIRQYESYAKGGYGTTATFTTTGCDDCRALPWHIADRPYSDLTPCGAHPDWWPCVVYTAPATRYVCSHLNDRYWSRWGCGS